ncbi:hypothetical protein PENTCL1PPCAC_15007, partial [Pristionchus entomophagus]
QVCRLTKDIVDRQAGKITATGRMHFTEAKDQEPSLRMYLDRPLTAPFCLLPYMQSIRRWQWRDSFSRIVWNYNIQSLVVKMPRHEFAEFL